ncbi:hypothetical protein HY486_01510 [Candidatus Woesearchaeota archaeon]|nr:hypothetical protein [Candidatus Woesearchaeota archaeon]
MIDDLEEVIERKTKTKKPRTEDLLPKTLRITRNALIKAKLIGPLLEKIADDDYEWSAFLLARKKDPTFTIRDLLIQKGQDIRYGNVTIDGTAVAQAQARIEKTQLYVIGWIHGHGNAQYLTPSPTDKTNFNTVLNSVGLNTEQPVKTPLQLIETKITTREDKGKIILTGESNHDATIEFIAEEEMLKQLLEGRIKQEVYENTLLGFAYFIIMSNNLKVTPYAAIQYSKETAITKQRRTALKENLRLDTIKETDDIAITIESLEKELRENIEIPKRWYSPTGWVPKKWRGKKGEQPCTTGDASGKQPLISYPGTQQGMPQAPHEPALIISGSMMAALRTISEKMAQEGKNVGEIQTFFEMAADLSRTWSPSDTIITEFIRKYITQEPDTSQTPTAPTQVPEHTGNKPDYNPALLPANEYGIELQKKEPAPTTIMPAQTPTAQHPAGETACDTAVQYVSEIEEPPTKEMLPLISSTTQETQQAQQSQTRASRAKTSKEIDEEVLQFLAKTEEEQAKEQTAQPENTYDSRRNRMIYGTAFDALETTLEQLEKQGQDTSRLKDLAQMTKEVAQLSWNPSPDKVTQVVNTYLGNNQPPAPEKKEEKHNDVYVYATSLKDIEHRLEQLEKQGQDTKRWRTFLEIMDEHDIIFEQQKLIDAYVTDKKTHAEPKAQTKRIYQNKKVCGTALETLEESIEQLEKKDECANHLRRFVQIAKEVACLPKNPSAEAVAQVIAKYLGDPPNEKATTKEKHSDLNIYGTALETLETTLDQFEMQGADTRYWRAFLRAIDKQAVIEKIDIPFEQKPENNTPVKDKEVHAEQKATKKTSKIIQASNKIKLYEKIEFQPETPELTLFHFDESIKHLLLAGFDRHPMPAEIYSLLIETFNNNPDLSPSLRATLNNFISPLNTWLDIVVWNDWNTLRFYEHPRNLKFVGNCYDLRGMTYSDQQTIKPSLVKNYYTIKELADICPPLVTYLWSCPFKEIPTQMHNYRFILPSKGSGFPLCLGEGYVIPANCAMARGVTERKQEQKK